MVVLHSPQHFTVAHVRIRERCIDYYDSLLPQTRRGRQRLLDDLHKDDCEQPSAQHRNPYVCMHRLRAGLHRLLPASWPVRLVESAPQQLAGSHDCGPIACHVARVLCEGGDLTTVDPTNPLALRDAIATAILQVRDEFTTRT